MNDVKALVKDGFLLVEPGAIRIKNLKVAQARTSSAERMARKRERDKNASQSPSHVTVRDASPLPLRSDGSRARGSVPISSDQIPPTPHGGANGANGQIEKESGYDLALRYMLEAWQERYREEYVLGTDTGPKGEHAALMRIGRKALELGGEPVMLHWASSYIADPDPWLSERRHAFRWLEQRLNQYGTRPSAVPDAPEVDLLELEAKRLAKISGPPPTPEERAELRAMLCKGKS